MRVPTLDCVVLDREDKKSKSKKGYNNSGKKHFELSPLIVWITLWIVNTLSEFQVNIFSNNRDITKCKSFCTTTTPRLYREHVHSVTVCQKYLTRLGELIIFEPWRENYHFSQPRKN